MTLEVKPSLVDDPTLEWGFLLHDVGKIAIPDEVLLKPGPLDAAERACMQQHTLLGEQLVSHVPLLQGAGLRVIRSHHERFDGTGYPDRPVRRRHPARGPHLRRRRRARRDDRRASLPHARSRWDEAINEVTQGRGSQFDPDVVDSLVTCEPDLHETYLEVRPAA